MTRSLVGIVLVALALTACGDGPRNTDPRKGRVVTQDGNCAWGDCTYDFHICVGPDLLVHISSADPEDHMVKNSPECAQDGGQADG